MYAVAAYEDACSFLTHIPDYTISKTGEPRQSNKLKQ